MRMVPRSKSLMKVIHTMMSNHVGSVDPRLSIHAYTLTKNEIILDTFVTTVQKSTFATEGTNRY